jgi:hypothetical protein
MTSPSPNTMAQAHLERSTARLIPYVRCRNMREETAILMPGSAWS